MLSGPVFFEEVVQEVKDLTGITNLRPQYGKIRRAIMKAEQDIGAGGFIIRKRKDYVNGDGGYDGTNIVLPEDFVWEYSHAKLSQGTINGKILTLNCPPGPDEISMYYMGWLLDDSGNPITTRNHLEAVVLGCIFRLYSSQYFLGNGNYNQYKEYQIQYNDMVMAARGNDAFPTEEEWIQIGRILNGGAFEAFTMDGLRMCDCSAENVIVDGSSPTIDTGGEGTYTCNLIEIFNSALIDGIVGDLLTFSSNITTGSTVVGVLKPKFDGAITTGSTISATLTAV